MNGEVQFQEQWQPQQRIPKKGWGEKLAGFLVKYSGGLIKDENQAAYVILGFVAVAIIISLFLFFGGGKSEIKAPPGQKIIYPPNEPPRLQQQF